MDRPEPKHFLAIDLGAESGRAMLATLAGGAVTLEEIHRFANEPVEILGTRYWDTPRLFLEIKRALAAAGAVLGERGEELDGIGVDAWGVDYALLDARGELIANPVHYRDPRTAGIVERVCAELPRETIYAETGLQFLELNTLFQLAAEKERNPERLARAARLLFVPDLFHYFLTGRAVSERTVASTSQLWNPTKGGWSENLVRWLGLPEGLLPDVVEPGTQLGPLRPELTAEAGLPRPPAVIATACHDTAAAIAAVPFAASAPEDGGSSGWAYISSGTWSLMGVELDAPLIHADALSENFTNEGGVGRTVRFLRNLMGLWLVQESRRQWESDGTPLSYDVMAALAEQAPPLRSVVYPEAPIFFPPGDMPARVREFCARTGQPVPENEAALLRCVLESLALSYRDNAERLERVTGRTLEGVHIVGGGSRNRLLNQLTADALGRPVIAGPHEATALGNALVQALGIGVVSSLAELRRIVREAGGTEPFAPRRATAGAWAAAARRFARLRDRVPT